LSLRAMPQVHGAVRDQFAHAAATVDAELASVSDNPAVLGTREAPRALSEAHAVGAALGLAGDALASPSPNWRRCPNGASIGWSIRW